MNALNLSHLCPPISMSSLQPGSLVSLWAPAWWSLVLVIPFALLRALEMLSGPVRAPQCVFPWELLWCSWAGPWGAADQTDVGPCPVLSHPSWDPKRRCQVEECCELKGTTDVYFPSLDSSLRSQKWAVFMEEIHCWRFWKLARICTIKLIKSLKKHSNSTKVSCCTASFPEEAVCIFKSVCKSFKSVLLQPQRVLQCCQKNCKEEIVNPWYSA